MSSPIILAIDTAQEYCSAAVVVEGRTAAERSVRVGNKHAEILLDMISEILAEAGLKKSDVSCVAFGAGPGSFTGLRVACGAAQGIAWGLGAKVAPVSNLEALALEAAAESGAKEGDVVVVMNDARMQQYYAQNFRVEKVGVSALDEPAVVDPEEVDKFINPAASILVGSAPYNEPELWKSAFSGRMIDRRCTRASFVGLAAWIRADRADGFIDPQDASPIYVRNKVAQTIAERRAAKEQQ